MLKSAAGCRGKFRRARARKESFVVLIEKVEPLGKAHRQREAQATEETIVRFSRDS
jgi:hypothetical protein